MRLRLAALLAVAFTLAGCARAVDGRPVSAAAGTTASPSAGSAPTGTQEPDVLPGEYGLRLLSAQKSGTRIAVRWPHGCADALDVLAAGQWQLTVLSRPTKAMPLSVALLQYAGALAVAYLQDVGGRCTGWLTTETDRPFTATGAVQSSGTAQALAFYCQIGPDPNGQSLNDLVAIEMALYRIAGRTFLLMAHGPATPGTHLVKTDEDGPGVMVIALPPGTSSVPAVTALLGQFLGSSDSSALEHLVTSAYMGTAKLTVTSGRPFVATLTGMGLRTENGKSTLSISAGLRCDG